MLTIHNLYAGYSKENPILKGIDLTVSNGEVIGILGRNGSGKSTLAKAICGLVPNISGEILLAGQSLIGLSTYQIAKMGVGFFQQGGRVFPNLTVNENIVFAVGSIDKKETDKRMLEIKEYFELLQKTDRLKLKASYLSGGEKHQLALAMVLVQKPKFLILDEPSAGLSPINQMSIFKALFSFCLNHKMPTLLIEQNIPIAKYFCSSIYTIQNDRFVLTLL